MAFRPNTIITEDTSFGIKNASKLSLDFIIQTTFKEQAINVIFKKEEPFPNARLIALIIFH